MAEAGEGVDEPVEVVFPGTGANEGEDLGVEVGGFGEGRVVGDAVAAEGRKDVGGEVSEDVVVGGEDDAVVGEDAAAFDGDGGAPDTFKYVLVPGCVWRSASGGGSSPLSWPGVPGAPFLSAGAGIVGEMWMPSS